MANKSLFTRKSPQLWPFFILFVFSILTARLDAHDHRLQFIRWAGAYLVTPLQFMVDYPQHLWRWLEALVSTKTNLVQENVHLSYQQTLLEAKLQHFLTLQTENVQLKALLRTAAKANTHAIAAQILGVDMRQSRQLIVLDKGWREGVREGQAVLAAKGIMGQIIDVGPSTSTVLLISDAKSAVPVRNDRTREWGILIGNNQPDALKLLHLPQTSPVRTGDVLVTSGLGGHYPEGYPIGIVTALAHASDDPFMHITVKPIAQLNQSQLVLILLPTQDEIALIKNIHTRLKVMEGAA